MANSSTDEPSIFIVRNGSSSTITCYPLKNIPLFYPFSSFCATLETGAHLSLWEFCPVCFSHLSPFSLSHLFASDSHLSASPSRRPKTANVKMSQILLKPPFSLFLRENTFNVIKATKN